VKKPSPAKKKTEPRNWGAIATAFAGLVQLGRLLWDIYLNYP